MWTIEGTKGVGYGLPLASTSARPLEDEEGTVESQENRDCMELSGPSSGSRDLSGCGLQSVVQSQGLHALERAGGDDRTSPIMQSRCRSRRKVQASSGSCGVEGTSLGRCARRKSLWLTALACAAILCAGPVLAAEEAAVVHGDVSDKIVARQASSEVASPASGSVSPSALPPEATEGLAFIPSTTTLSNASSASGSGSGDATSTILYPTSGNADGSGGDSVSQLPTGVSRLDGQPTPTSSSQPHDPLLAIMPDFAFSMPAQIVANGINIALVTVLAIHLLFTAQYHYPLSSRNYVLQAVSTFMLLISLSVQLDIVLKKLNHQSHTWPYMFAYIGVQTPPQDGSWSTVQEAFFLLMRACTTALAHVSVAYFASWRADEAGNRAHWLLSHSFVLQLTHIQFLTLLFPSALEARLILWMLGPLALAASGMEFTALSSSDDVKTSDLGDAIRNICNSTLTLLYTSALLIWGLLVNRRRAWRTDGGTAAFGGGSVGLAIINTAISFVEIAFDRVWWLPDMCWTLTIWQSWLGFWWWVGSGMVSFALLLLDGRPTHSLI